MTQLFENISLAIAGLRANKMRALLTMLGQFLNTSCCPFKIKKEENKKAEFNVATKTQPLHGSNLFACVDAVLAVELIDTSASLCCLLLASVERMALRANFNVKFGLGRAGYECVATVTGYSCLVVVRMDSCFHFLSPRLILIGYLYLFSSARPFGHCL